MPFIIDLDLSERAAAKEIVERVLSAFGRIDALVNIAGAVPQIDLFEMTDEQWDAGLALKPHGARRLTIEAWPALKGAKGSVVLMSGNRAVSQGTLCSGRWHDQCRDRRPCKGVRIAELPMAFRSTASLPGPGDDGTPSLIPRMGVDSRDDVGTGYGEISAGCGHFSTLRGAGRDRS